MKTQERQLHITVAMYKQYNVADIKRQAYIITQVKN